MLTSWSDHLYQIHLHADDDNDIIDEALYFFKANVFFKSYEVKVRNVNNCLYFKFCLVGTCTNLVFLFGVHWRMVCCTAIR